LGWNPEEQRRRGRRRRWKRIIEEEAEIVRRTRKEGNAWKESAVLVSRMTDASKWSNEN
jgi:hypothetical protein